MRSWASTIVIVAAFVGLLWYVMGVRPPRATQENEEASELALFNVDREKINEIKITGRLDESTEDLNVILRRVAGDDADPFKVDWWFIKSDGSEVPGNATRADSLAIQLAYLRADRQISAESGNLKDFGLDSPRMKVEFTVASSESAPENDIAHWVAIGNPTPVAGHEPSYYLLVDAKPGVYTVSKGVLAQFTGKAGDFRDSYFVDVPTSRLQKLVLTRAGKVATVVKQGDGSWSMEGSASGKVDDEKLRSLMSEFNLLRAEEFVNDNPSKRELKEYGFDEPQLVAEFWVEKSETDKSLASFSVIIGGTSPDGGRVYVKSSAGPWIYAVSRDALTKVLIDPETLRN